MSVWKLSQGLFFGCITVSATPAWNLLSAYFMIGNTIARRVFSGRPNAEHRQPCFTDVWFDISKYLWWWWKAKTGLWLLKDMLSRSESCECHFQCGWHGFFVVWNYSLYDVQAASNLIVLAREPAGAEKIFANNGVASLLRLLDTERDKELQLTSLRVLACLSADHRERVGNDSYLHSIL